MSTKADSRHKCEVPGCTIEDRKLIKNLTWHKFPERPLHRKQKDRWTEIIRQCKADLEWLPSKDMYLCSRHFNEDDMQSIGGRGRTPKHTADPQLYLPQTIVADTIMDVECETVQNASKTETIQKNSKFPNLIINGQLIFQDFTDAERFTPMKIEISACVKGNTDLSKSLSYNMTVELSDINSVLDQHSTMLEFTAHANIDNDEFNIKLNDSDSLRTPSRTEMLNKSPEPLRKRPRGKPPIKGRILFTPEPPVQVKKDEATPRTIRKRMTADHPYCVKTTPTTALRKVSKRYAAIRKINRIKTQKLTRKSAALKKLKVKMQDKLKSSKTLSEEQMASLTKEFPTVLNMLIGNEMKASKVKDKCGMRYSEEMRKFAATLHFHSPKAYCFIRQYISLPHPSTLVTWMSAADCGPGFSADVIRRLGDARAADFKNTMTDIVMQVDEMSIRKDTPWDATNGKFAGHVDFGSDDVSENSSLATNALVCLVAGISGGWKCPIGYVFTDKVDGNGMVRFVSKGFELLEKENFNVHALISDGYPANVAMFRTLGAVEEKFPVASKRIRKSKGSTVPSTSATLSGSDLPSANITYDEIQSGFPNPSNAFKTVYTIYDVVHMLKLWRNMLAQCSCIEWEHGPIRWSFVQKLYEVQENEGIIAANKLTKYHIDFERHKMKVSYVAQALSCSVADAIDFCRDDMKLDEFQGSKSTTDFIRTLDRAFDYLNSQKSDAKGFKSPITRKNLMEKATFLENFAKKILGMTYTETRTAKKIPTQVRIIISQSKRKRPVLGLVTSIKSIIAICHELLKREIDPFYYILTYRFSQDLLELFFNKVRGRLGRNNNPNVVEFRNIMRRIWHQNLLKSNSTGNCIEQMEEGEVPGGLLPLAAKPKTKRDLCVSEIGINDVEDIEYSQFYLNCLGYIAGNVALALTSKIHCVTCVSVLKDSAEDTLDKSVRYLIERKNRGGLVFPSQSVYKLIEMTDVVFRSILNSSTGVPSLDMVDIRISLVVMKNCVGVNLFPSLGNHSLYFDPKLGESHYSFLIKRVVHHYLRIRLFDLGKRNRRSLAVSTRHTLTKQILFNND